MWQLGTLILIIYQSIVLPYSLAFGGSGNTVIDTVTNVIFGLDIVIQFNTPVAGLDEGTEYVTDRWEIARIYCRGWLFFDVLACIPFDSLLLWINQYDAPGSGNNLNVLGLLKAMRIPRLLRIIRVLRVLKILKINPEIRRWLQYSRHANLLRLVRLVASFLIINHYVACIWYGAIESDELKSQDENKSTVHLYISSFYTSLLMIMGQNITLYTDPEYVFSVAAMLFGSVLQAVVFGNVAMLIANYYENQSSHQKKMEWLFASMSRMKLPLDLQNRINDYYQAMWERHGTLDGAVTAFIPELSRNLAYEVELFLRMDMINRAPIFQSCSAKVVQELVMELELQVFMPGDYVVVRGEVGNDMYFVQNGICEVTKEVNPQTTQSFSPSVQAVPPDVVINEVVLKTLGQGDYFGEIALLMNCKRTANVRAQVFSELCALTRDVFENISLRYLEDRNIIEKFIMDKYDPSMLQAAMKQSQELSMRTLGVGPRPSILKRSTTPALDTDAIEILRRIEERIHKLEQRIEKDGEERRTRAFAREMVDSEDVFRLQSTPPQPPLPPEIEGYLKKLKRKTSNFTGGWNKRWFFVDPKRREFGYAKNKSPTAPRSSIYLNDITAVVQFDQTHFQVESRTRTFFLCGESKASTSCWVKSLEEYRKKLVEYEKDVAKRAASATHVAHGEHRARAPNAASGIPGHGYVMEAWVDDFD
ncbi:hypothetical protein Poli38472_002782 [Pythium oligandrum]|uniref:Uncharacterized protein n=1 Tax=Pythium oligandrum TaxID=41045 RepID=A0A8K1FIH8_PYTOL|nr:hypothetical protein Poli38472_002782 [Pythium oligandrum]|eukprot:TMW63841.1 hypothetical protein Poli38472_002782 [Pythium oligandrum]